VLILRRRRRPAPPEQRTLTPQGPPIEGTAPRGGCGSRAGQVIPTDAGSASPVMPAAAPHAASGPDAPAPVVRGCFAACWSTSGQTVTPCSAGCATSRPPRRRLLRMTRPVHRPVPLRRPDTAQQVPAGACRQAERGPGPNKWRRQAMDRRAQ
jgi:hypothetical protein